MTEQKKYTRIVGFSLVLMAVFAGVGFGYAFNSFYSSTEKDVTLALLISSPSLLRLTIVCFVAILILDIIVAWAFYMLLKKNNESLSLLSALFRLIYSALLGVSIFYLLAAFRKLGLGADELKEVVFQIDLFVDSWAMGLVIFGFHLVLLGLILIKITTFPKFLAYLTLIAGISYSFTNFAKLLIPSYLPYSDTVDMALGLPMALGEIGIAIWFLIYGGKKSLG